MLHPPAAHTVLKPVYFQPLWGFSSPHAPIAYRKTAHASGNLYFVDDEEIDLNKLLSVDLPPIPRDISYTSRSSCNPLEDSV